MQLYEWYYQWLHQLVLDVSAAGSAAASTGNHWHAFSVYCTLNFNGDAEPTKISCIVYSITGDTVLCSCAVVGFSVQPGAVSIWML